MTSKVEVKVSFDRNERIRVPQVRLIGSAGENKGVVTTSEALSMARSEELDLVLISPTADVPVAKIVDWSKFKYSQQKKHKNAVKGRTKSKEWWFKPNIEDHDIRIKLKNIKSFLEKGGTAKITLRSQKRIPRNMMYETINRVLELAGEFSEPLSEEIAKEGRNLSTIIKLKSRSNEEVQTQDSQGVKESV